MQWRKLNLSHDFCLHAPVSPNYGLLGRDESRDHRPKAEIIEIYHDTSLMSMEKSIPNKTFDKINKHKTTAVGFKPKSTEKYPYTSIDSTVPNNMRGRPNDRMFKR